MAQATQLSPPPVVKRNSKKQSLAVLSTCPINGPGWCPYPFSAEQLKKHLRKVEQQQASAQKKAMKKTGAS